MYKYTVWVFHQGQKALVFECFARYTETKGLIYPELYLDLADMFECVCSDQFARMRNVATSFTL